MNDMTKGAGMKLHKIRRLKERLGCLLGNLKILSKPSFPDELLLRHLLDEIKYLTSRAADLQYGLDGLTHLEERLAALQALDVSFRHSGKLVILSRVGKQDFCKILDIRPDMTMMDIRELTEIVKERYGVPVGYFDSPIRLDAEEFLRQTNRR